MIWSMCIDVYNWNVRLVGSRVLEEEQASVDGGDCDGARGEERVDGPCAEEDEPRALVGRHGVGDAVPHVCKVRDVARDVVRRHVEEADLLGIRGHVRGPHAEAGRVVRVVRELAVDVQIVVDSDVVRGMDALVLEREEGRDVEVVRGDGGDDPRLLVDLVAHHKARVVLREPALVHKRRVPRLVRAAGRLHLNGKHRVARRDRIAEVRVRVLRIILLAGVAPPNRRNQLELVLVGDVHHGNLVGI
mmetsp:Transcript_11940/g.42189  ORF Transcript_11940/g.42189 Transcript_11940/m.42189 type:complete len:246 (-) Transcript_11940:495-1232(-)